MRRFLAIASLVSFLLVSAYTHAAPEAVGIKVYTGDNGVEVAIVQLKAPGKFLIQVTSSRSALDGLVLPYDLSASGENYNTSWRGMSYTFVTSRRPYGGTSEMALTTPNDVSKRQSLVYSEKRSREVVLADLLAKHQKQFKDGSIARFGRFDRLGEQARTEEELAKTARSLGEACGLNVPVGVLWPTITDAQLKSYSVAGYCGAPLEGMESLCRSGAMKGAIQAKVKAFTCQFGDTTKIDLDEKGTFAWTTKPDATNLEEITKNYWRNLPDATPSGEAKPVASSEVPPWGLGRTLGEKEILERTHLCTDGKSAFIALSPDERNLYKIYYGNGKKFARVFENYHNNFFDPRQYNPKGNPNFRGLDMRLYSTVDVDEARKMCSVRCGTRRTELKLLDTKATLDTLLAATIAPPVHDRKPHVLTRDDKGNYYYVDRGNSPNTEKSFRLFTGPRGSLKLRAMTNVISDSKGEIFSTKNGSLRFITGPGGVESTWVQGKKAVKLVAIPVEENFSLIYNELGIYSGERLGTPCDDF